MSNERPKKEDYLRAADEILRTPIRRPKPSLQQDVEEWIDGHGFCLDNGHNHPGTISMLGKCTCTKLINADDLRAFLAGKVLVPVIELNDVLEMAGLALSMTPLDSRERKSFRAVADAIK